MTRPMMHDNERVVYITYHNGIPHEVITASKNGYCRWFDFEYFYGDKKDIRWYNSGGGGHMTELQAPHYAKSAKGVTYWMAEDAAFKGKPRNCKRLDRPIRVKGWRRSSINPFKAADETNRYGYCDRCGHHVVDECDLHQYWDDKTGVVRYYDNNEAAE